MADPHNSDIGSTEGLKEGNAPSNLAAVNRAELLSPSTDSISTAPPIRRSPNIAQAVLLASALAQLAIALLITVYLAREISPSAFGFFSLVGTIFILARKFLDLGLSNVAAREATRDPRRERPILEGMMAYRRAAGAVLGLAVFIFGWTKGPGSERYVLLAVGMLLLFTEPAALDPVFQVRQAQAAPALLNVLAGLLVLGGVAVLKKLAVAGAAFAWLLVVREAAILLFTMVLAERLLGYRPQPGFRARELRGFVGPAVIFGLASLVYTIYFNCDVFLVYVLRGQEELGAYAAAFRPINPLLLLPWFLMVPMIPVLTAAAARDRKIFVGQVRSLCRLALGIGACGLVAGILLAPDLIQLLYRGRYLDGPLSSVNAFRWLAVALGQVCVTTVLTAALLADGKEKVLLAIGAFALVINVAINVVALRYYNFTAAGVATAFTEFLFLAGALVAFQFTSEQFAFSWESGKYLFPALTMAVILYWIRGGPAVRVSCGILLGVLGVATILISGNARQFRKEMTAAATLF